MHPFSGHGYEAEFPLIAVFRFAGPALINQDRNCWTYLDTVGWRRLSEASESGLVAMNMLASDAYQLNATASLYEADDGRIAQLYVW